MSLFNDASLVLIPSGYKEDTVYSVKPTDGSGDLTFTRASDGTRVNSQGYIERVPWNLLTYSEDFSNWIKSSGSSVVYNATEDAYEITKDAAAFRFIRQTKTLNGYLTFYGLFKKGTLDNVTLRLFPTPDSYARFNLNNGTLVNSANTLSTAITDEGNGWYLCQMVVNSTSCTEQLIYPDFYTNSTAGYVLAKYAQINEDTTAKPYFPTTDRLNVPRLDYSNGCPSLLLEPQRTNLVRYSEQFDNASWVKPLGWTITANATTSPDGNTNADLVTPTNFNNLSQSSNVVASTDYTVSVYVKKGTTNFSWVSLVFSGGTSINYGYVINWSTLTISLIPARTSAINPTFENVGNGWYRISFVCASGNNTSASLQIIPDTQAGTASIYLWGAQLEAGSYPTSYIPTTSASVTRVADAAYKTGISSLIGQTEGTVFLDLEIDELGTGIDFVTLNNSTNNEYIAIWKYDTDSLRYRVRANGINNTIDSTLSSTGRHKLALIYKASSIALFVDGVKINEISATVSFSTQIDQVLIAPSLYTTLNKHKNNQTVIYKTPLSDSEAIALTTI